MTDHNAADDAGSGPPRREPQSSSAREAAWEEVATHLSNLGKQVRSRFERPAESGPAGRSAGEQPTERTTSEGPTGERTEAQPPSGETVRRFIDTLDDAFKRLGDTVRDPAFRKEAGSSVERLGQALGLTLTEFGQQLEGRFGRGRTTAGDERMADVPPPPPADTTPPPAGTTSSEDVPPAPPPAAPARESQTDRTTPPEERPPGVT